MPSRLPFFNIHVSSWAFDAFVLGHLGEKSMQTRARERSQDGHIGAEK